MQFGNLIALIGTGFLIGFLQQLKNMADEKRRVASAIYITALVGTLLAVFLIPNPTGKMFAAILCIVVQFCALAWYTVRVPADAVLRARARRWGALRGGATAPEPRRPPTCVARLRAGTPPEEGGQTRERPRLGERCSVWRRLLNTPSHPVLALPFPRLPSQASYIPFAQSFITGVCGRCVKSGTAAATG